SLMGTFENNAVGAGWSNLSNHTSVYGSFTQTAAILMVIASYPMYAFLIWYLDNVWPFQYGVPKSPWFLFLPSYWLPKADTDADTSVQHRDTLDEKIYEREPAGLAPSIQVRNV